MALQPELRDALERLLKLPVPFGSAGSSEQLLLALVESLVTLIRVLDATDIRLAILEGLVQDRRW